jgi:hypothetical protein
MYDSVVGRETKILEIINYGLKCCIVARKLKTTLPGRKRRLKGKFATSAEFCGVNLQIEEMTFDLELKFTS